MNFKAAFILLIAAIVMFGCSRQDSGQKEAYISGTLTVDENLDSSGDYSGIQLLVSFQTSDGEARDTLFHAVTDVEGNFSGTANFENRDLYPVIVSRNQNTFGVLNMVFADGDSISINAE